MSTVEAGVDIRPFHLDFQEDGALLERGSRRIQLTALKGGCHDNGIDP
jgi:hypothetical protein